MRERLSALEQEMGTAGFWDDPDNAARVSAEHTRTQRRLDTFTKLQSDADDLAELAEMAEEIDVASARDELQRAEGGGDDFDDAAAAAARARARLRAAGESPDR